MKHRSVLLSAALVNALAGALTLALASWLGGALRELVAGIIERLPR